MKPNGIDVAKAAIDIWQQRPTYQQLDCQAYVEQAVINAGGSMSYLGSNDMARHAAVWLGTLDNAKAEGKLVSGAGLLIHKDDESNLPARYQGDGLGDFSHVGLYLGDDLAVQDKPKGSLLNKKCNCVHSSASMGRVAGTTVKNGWTHVIWFKEIDYGVDVASGVTLGANVPSILADPVDQSGFETINAQLSGASAPVIAMVYSENRKPVKLRAKPSTKCPIYWTRDIGTAVTVLERGDTWCKVRSRSRQGYMMTQFLVFEGGDLDG